MVSTELKTKTRSMYVCTYTPSVQLIDGHAKSIPNSCIIVAFNYSKVNRSAVGVVICCYTDIFDWNTCKAPFRCLALKQLKQQKLVQIPPKKHINSCLLEIPRMKLPEILEKMDIEVITALMRRIEVDKTDWLYGRFEEIWWHRS